MPPQAAPASNIKLNTLIGLLIDRAPEFVEGFWVVFTRAPLLEFGPMDSTHLAETDKDGLVKEITGAPVYITREPVFYTRGGG